MRRPSSRRASRTPRRVIAGGMDAGAVGPCIEVASAMAMLISSDYGSPRGQLNPGARTSRRLVGYSGATRGRRTGGATTAERLGTYLSRASSATTVRPPMTSPESAATALIEEILSHANEGRSIAHPDARRAHFAHALVGEQLLQVARVQALAPADVDEDLEEIAVGVGRLVGGNGRSRRTRCGGRNPRRPRWSPRADRGARRVLPQRRARAAPCGGDARQERVARRCARRARGVPAAREARAALGARRTRGARGDAAAGRPSAAAQALCARGAGCASGALRPPRSPRPRRGRRGGRAGAPR